MLKSQKKKKCNGGNHRVLGNAQAAGDWERLCHSAYSWAVGSEGAGTKQGSSTGTLSAKRGSALSITEKDCLRASVTPIT